MSPKYVISHTAISHFHSMHMFNLKKQKIKCYFSINIFCWFVQPKLVFFMYESHNVTFTSWHSNITFASKIINNNSKHCLESLSLLANNNNNSNHKSSNINNKSPSLTTTTRAKTLLSTTTATVTTNPATSTTNQHP